MEIYEMTALEVAEKIRNKEITAMDAVEAVSDAIASRDKTYNCYTHFDKELAFEKAQAAQQLIDSGKADLVVVAVLNYQLAPVTLYAVQRGTIPLPFP